MAEAAVFAWKPICVYSRINLHTHFPISHSLASIRTSSFLGPASLGNEERTDGIMPGRLDEEEFL